MALSPEMMGVLLGGALGVLSYVIITGVMDRLTVAPDKRVEVERQKRIVRIVALADIAAFPVVGYFVGPLIFS